MLKLATLTAAALGLAAVAAQADDAVRVGTLKFAHYAGVAYMAEIAESCGIDLDIKTFAKGPDVMQAILAGELDVGAAASEAAISARGNGAPIYVVSGFASGGARLVAAPDSGIASVADLKGKKVGVTRGGIHEVLLAAELGKNGLSEKDIEITYLAFPDLNQALMQKQIDAMMQTEPQSSQAIARGFGVEVMKPYDTPIGAPIRPLVMSEDFYDNHKDAAAKFMACFVRSQKTLMDDPKLAETYVTQTMFKGQLTPEEFQAAIANSPYTLDMSAEHIQNTTDVMAEYGIGKMRKPAPAAEWVKLDLLDAARAADTTN